MPEPPKDEALLGIAQRFKDKMAAQGMDVTGAGPGEDGTPTINVYLHSQDRGSRRGTVCDCREDDA